MSYSTKLISLDFGGFFEVSRRDGYVNLIINEECDQCGLDEVGVELTHDDLVRIKNLLNEKLNPFPPKKKRGGRFS